MDTGTLFARVAAVLRREEASLTSSVSDRCFEELPSYQRETMPREESRGTVGRLLDCLVARLEQEPAELLSVGTITRELHGELVRLEQGIASRRVEMSISFEDLLRGISFMRQEIWTRLKVEFASESVGLWELETLVNAVFEEFVIGLSSAYLASASEQIAHQQSSLAKWEEVVRSASHIRLKIPCLEEYASTVRLQAEAIARRVQFTDEELYDIITAVGEVCDNAIEHGRSELGVEVEYVLTPTEFRVEVKDHGSGFDPTGRGEQPPDVFAESGRGIFLMKHLMDGMEIDAAPGRGTRIVMTKLRRPNA